MWSVPVNISPLCLPQNPHTVDFIPTHLTVRLRDSRSLSDGARVFKSRFSDDKTIIFLSITQFM